MEGNLLLMSGTRNQLPTGAEEKALRNRKWRSKFYGDKCLDLNDEG
jgi:hypothetical protein